MASIHITGEKDSVLLAGLEEWQNFDNLRGVIVIDLLMEIRVFISNLSINGLLLSVSIHYFHNT